MMRLLTAAAFVLLLAGPAHAIFTEKPLEDPAAEARAQELMKDLRCLVCQNQAISESGAPLARDMRVLLRERVVLGESDAEIEQFFVTRYGDWVKLNPPFKMKTAILWFGPLLILIPGIIIAFIYLRRRPGRHQTVGAAPGATSQAVALDADERRELQRALSSKE